MKQRGRHTDPNLKAEAFKLLRQPGAMASEVARTLGIGVRTVERYRREVIAAAQRGEYGFEPVLPGYRLSKSTATYGPGGELERQSVQQLPDHGEEFTAPAGHIVKGVSALLDAEGRKIVEWVKTREGERTVEETAAIVQKAFEDWAPAAPAILIPADCDADRLTSYIQCDWHLGLRAWGRETAGPDWDLPIAKGALLGASSELVQASPPSRHAVVLGLGDLLHADNSLNQTERSKHVLDVDGRYPKCLATLCDVLVEHVEQVAVRHEDVEVVFKPGNHDPNSTHAIAYAMRMYFRNSRHVRVDTSPDPFYWRRFGVNLIGGVHGDRQRPKDLAWVMANRRAQDWGATTTRHMHTGHVHHDTVLELGGVHVFTHRAPVAQDAWHAACGFLSGRSMKSFTYHADKGARGHTEIEIK